MARRHALLLGVSNYSDAKLSRLNKPATDVAALARVLENTELGAFDEVQTLTECTRAQAELAVKRLCKGKTPDDLILLYFSGHGVRDLDANAYLATQDAELEDLFPSALPAFWINSMLERSRSQRKILMLDCCHGGAFAAGTTIKAPLGESAGIAATFSGYGLVTITASDATQFAFEGDDVHGEAVPSVFTRYVVDGIESGRADRDGDGRISVQELYQYVYDAVIRENPSQKPQRFGKEEGQLWLSKAPIRPAPLPSFVREALQISFAQAQLSVFPVLEQFLVNGPPGMALTAYDELLSLAEGDSFQVRSAAANLLNRHPNPFGVGDLLRTRIANTRVTAIPDVSVPATVSDIPPQADAASSPTSAEPNQPETGVRVNATPTSSPDRRPTEPPTRRATRVSTPRRPEVSLIRTRPSLLDVLTLASEQGVDQTYEEFMIRVSHDVERLMNTERSSAELYSETSRSTAAYGLPDLSHLTRDNSSASRDRGRALIENAIKQFEPRLAHVNVSLVVDDWSPGAMEFLVDAVTCTTPEVPVRLRIAFDRARDRLTVREA
jgi:type VI secretion system lysozyme-like protein